MKTYVDFKKNLVKNSMWISIKNLVKNLSSELLNMEKTSDFVIKPLKVVRNKKSKFFTHRYLIEFY